MRAPRHHEPHRLPIYIALVCLESAGNEELAPDEGAYVNMAWAAKSEEAVRVMQGNPGIQYLNSQSPYLRWRRNGQALDINGNVVPRTSASAHIPLQHFKCNPGVYR
jgi:hypothetical protein